MMWTEVKERAKRAGNGPHHPSFIHQPSVTSLQSPPYSRFPWLVHPRLTTLTGEETTVRRG